jgi:hypothetical protein
MKPSSVSPSPSSLPRGPTTLPSASAVPQEHRSPRSGVPSGLPALAHTTARTTSRPRQSIDLNTKSTAPSSRATNSSPTGQMPSGIRASSSAGAQGSSSTHPMVSSQTPASAAGAGGGQPPKKPVGIEKSHGAEVKRKRSKLEGDLVTKAGERAQAMGNITRLRQDIRRLDDRHRAAMAPMNPGNPGRLALNDQHLVEAKEDVITAIDVLRSQVARQLNAEVTRRDRLGGELAEIRKQLAELKNPTPKTPK